MRWSNVSSYHLIFFCMDISGRREEEEQEERGRGGRRETDDLPGNGFLSHISTTT